MRNIILTTVLCSFLGLSANATLPIISAARKADQNWYEALSQQPNFNKKLLFSNHGMQNFTEGKLSPQSIGGVPEWKKSLAELNALSFAAHEIRKYNNPNGQPYMRKAPWLYPLDGCFAKAAHISAIAISRGEIAPGKVFAYGKLRLRSKYVKEGEVRWSYHVVAAYHIGETVYVIDPVVGENDDGTYSPVLTVSDWVKKLSAAPTDVKVTYCDKNAYDPNSPCIGGQPNGAYLGHVSFYLNEEYQNLISIGLNPDQLLAPQTNLLH
jgi:Glutaminase